MTLLQLNKKKLLGASFYYGISFLIFVFKKLIQKYIKKNKTNQIW